MIPPRMLFHSLSFIFLFLPGVMLLFYACGERGRPDLAKYVLLLGSLLFYGSLDAWGLPIFLASATTNYLLGRKLLQVSGTRSRWMLGIGIAGNVLLLAYSKYGLVPGRHLLILGISFFTFSQISFLVSAYGKRMAKGNFADYVLFLATFQHLVAGPIVHHARMVPQFQEPAFARWNWHQIALGAALFTVGLFKKTCIADELFPYANLLYGAQAPLSFTEAWLAVLAFAGQIYFDFSGYSDMAIALALLFGLRLPINFRSPYRATNIADFWQRWNISVSLWFRNYVYFPLVMRGLIPPILCGSITLFLSGIWHGAGWTFVAYGLAHALLYAAHSLWARSGNLAAIPGGTFLARALTFLCVALTLVFFRAESVSHAFAIFASAFSAPFAAPAALTGETLASLVALLTFAYSIIWFAPNTVELFGLGDVPPAPARPVPWRPTSLSAACLGAVLLLGLMGSFSKDIKFIYFFF